MNISSIREKAQARLDSASKNERLSVPVVWIPDGTTLVRFYLDSDGNFVRTFWRHKITEPKISVPCLSEMKGWECPICKHLATKSDNWEYKWRFAPKEVSIAYAYILSHIGEGVNIPAESPVLLMYNYKLANELSNLIQSLETDEEITRFFTPTTAFHVTQIKASNRGREFSMGFLTRQSSVPTLSDGLPPLTECVIPEDLSQVSESDYQEIIRVMDQSYERWASLSKSSQTIEAARHMVESETVSETPTVQQPTTVTSSKKETSSSNVSEPAQNIKTGSPPINCPSAFGSKPQAINPICLLCPVETMCQQATPSHKA